METARMGRPEEPAPTTLYWSDVSVQFGSHSLRASLNADLCQRIAADLEKIASRAWSPLNGDISQDLKNMEQPPFQEQYLNVVVPLTFQQLFTFDDLALIHPLGLDDSTVVEFVLNHWRMFYELDQAELESAVMVEMGEDLASMPPNDPQHPHLQFQQYGVALALLCQRIFFHIFPYIGQFPDEGKWCDASHMVLLQRTPTYFVVRAHYDH